MARSHVEIVHSDEVAPKPFVAPGWPPGADLRLLSRDDETGALTGLLDLPAGWRQEPWSVDEGCRLLLMPRSGPPGFEPEAGAAPGTAPGVAA